MTGGNRKLWQGHDITAVEINQDIANIYHDFYPEDKIIVADAHEYLLQHYKEYDFIWSSPPCPTHSILNTSINDKENKFNKLKIRYPDMTLYQEIIMLDNFCKCKWIVENVKPYYKLLMQNYIYFDRHLFWSNFIIKPIKIKTNRKHMNIECNTIVYGYDLSKYKVSESKGKRKALRNMVNPEIGKYILECAMYKDELFKELV